MAIEIPDASGSPGLLDANATRGALAAIELAIAGLDNPIVLIPTGVTATDTTAMDAAVVTALADKRPIVLKAGTFQRSTAWDLRGEGLHVAGAGRRNTFIKQMTTNTAGIKVGHLYQDIGGFTVINNEQSPSTDTAANGIEFYKAGFSRYSQIASELFARGLFIPQANYDASAFGLGATQNWVFSNEFNSMKVKGFAICGISMVTFGGGSTGNVWNNTYISNDWSGSIATCTEDAARFSLCDELVLNQFNIEWCSVPNYDVLSFVSAGPVVVNALHFEQVTIGQFNACFVRPYDSRVTVNGLSMSTNTLTNSGTHAVVKLSTALDHMIMNGFRQHDQTIAGTWVLAYAETGAAGAGAWFFGCYITTGAGLFSAVRSDLAFPNIPVIKQINDTVYAYKNSAGKNVIYGTAAPTTGAWIVGDTCWNTAPAAAGTPGWVCTTAGSPGTWKAMAALAA